MIIPYVEKPLVGEHFILHTYFKHYLRAIFYDITILYIFLRTPLNLVFPFSAWPVWEHLSIWGYRVALGR